MCCVLGRVACAILCRNYFSVIFFWGFACLVRADLASLICHFVTFFLLFSSCWFLCLFLVVALSLCFFYAAICSLLYSWRAVFLFSLVFSSCFLLLFCATMSFLVCNFCVSFCVLLNLVVLYVVGIVHCVSFLCMYWYLFSFLRWLFFLLLGLFLSVLVLLILTQSDLLRDTCDFFILSF